MIKLMASKFIARSLLHEVSQDSSCTKSRINWTEICFLAWNLKEYIYSRFAMEIWLIERIIMKDGKENALKDAKKNILKIYFLSFG